ncbi:MAG: flagellar hook-length control protein FliK [Aeoliella sp.]
MSPSIPNNVLPFVTNVSETSPEPNSSPGFDHQLQRQVAKSQAEHTTPDRASATNSRDDQVASSNSDADGNTGHEEVKDHGEISEPEVHGAPNGDPPSEDEPQDTVEVSESSQTEADAQQKTTRDVEVVISAESVELIAIENAQSENTSQLIVAPVDELANETIDEITSEGETKPSLLGSNGATSDSSAEHQTESRPTPESNLAAASTLAGKPEKRLDGAPLSESALSDAASTELPFAVSQVAGTTSTKETGEVPAPEAVASSVHELAEAESTSNDPGANGESEPRERREPRSRVVQAQQVVETTQGELPAQAALQKAEQAAGVHSTVAGDTEAAITDKQSPAPPTTTGSSNLLPWPATEQTSTTATQESSLSDSPRVDAGRFVSRVARAFQAAEQRGGTVQLRLSPPELGAMKIELSVQQGVLTAKLETETAASKSLLLDNLPALRERLAAQEIRVEKFEVDVRQQGSGSDPDWQTQQEQQGDGLSHEQKAAETEVDLDRNGPTAEAETSERTPKLSPDGRLNVVA